MKKVENLLVCLNLWRIIPAYLIFKTNHFKEKCDMDFAQWKLYSADAIQTHTNLFQFGYILLYEKSCRNIFLNRLHRNPFMYIIVRMLFSPLESCYINMPPEKIGGGFSFQHGFSTIVSANQLGNNCRVYQQVTIGYKGTQAPTIGNDVKVGAGAIVIGGIQVGDGAHIGAGAVVNHDVPCRTVVAGVPARIIKEIEP